MPNTTAAIHGYSVSQHSAKAYMPRVEAMPFPPLNFIVTG